MKWNVREYNRHAFYVSKYGEDLVDILKPQKGEYVLDLGCGDGTLARQIAERGARVHCVDYSDSMVAAAREKGVSSTVLDAHALSFDQVFDAVFSNAAMHWMNNPRQVLCNVLRALKAGGRFVAEFGAHGNLSTVTDAITTALGKHHLDFKDYNPWFFPTKEEYRALLEEAQFKIETIITFERPTPLSHDFSQWLRVFADPFLVDISADAHDQFFHEIEEKVRDKLYTKERGWVVDYVRIRFIAHRG